MPPTVSQILVTQNAPRGAIIFGRRDHRRPKRVRFLPLLDRPLPCGRRRCQDERRRRRDP